jgi:hypothetical protein
VAWLLRLGGWATGRQPVTVKQQTAGKPKLWPRKRLSEIDLVGGKVYQMRDEYSSSECGIVYEQVLISAKLQMGKRGKKQS